MKVRVKFFVISTCVLLLVLSTLPRFSHAETVAQLQEQINAHNEQIAALNKEIEQYQEQLKQTSAKKQTLQNNVDQITLNIKKTTAQVDVLQKQIATTQLEIQQLSEKINAAQNSINFNVSGLAQAIRTLHEGEQQPLAVQILTNGSLSQMWNDVSALSTVQGAIKDRIDNLAVAKKNLDDAKHVTVTKQDDLVKQRGDLRQKQGSLNAQKKTQSELLTQTKSQESAYQKLIAQKKAQEAQFEAALTDLKAQFQQALNPSLIPKTGSGILAWPLDDVRITQYFGNTQFAASGAYNGKGHNGIDLAAPIGTPVHAALGGVVKGTGNTDDVKGCYSFGKWVYVKHANGLGTIYAHLSEIVVSQGQQVTTGQLLGYSGETGYATGPHLHFSVYVDSATKIIMLGEATQSKTPCSTATMPVTTSIQGYLNPMSYLPKQ